MLIGFIKLDDNRLKEYDDFEVLQLDKNGFTVESTWYENMTFCDIVSDFKAKYKSKLQITVLDYGHEIEGVITAQTKEGDQEYRVLILY